MNKQVNIQLYQLIDLHSGKKDLHRYDRIGALKEAHALNKRNPNKRYGICAV